MARRRKKNGAVTRAIAVSAAQTAAPLVPILALLGLGYWAWKKYLESGATAAAAQAARTAGEVAQGYGQAAAIATDPSQWRPTYAREQAAWQASGEHGSPVAQPYYGPAGAWGP